MRKATISKWILACANCWFYSIVTKNSPSRTQTDKILEWTIGIPYKEKISLWMSLWKPIIFTFWEGALQTTVWKKLQVRACRTRAPLSLTSSEAPEDLVVRCWGCGVFWRLWTVLCSWSHAMPWDCTKWGQACMFCPQLNPQQMTLLGGRMQKHLKTFSTKEPLLC
jgi:hypothetical protein